MNLRIFLKIEDSEKKKKEKSSNVSNVKKKNTYISDNYISFYIIQIRPNLVKICIF